MAEGNKRFPVEQCADAKAAPGASVKLSLINGDTVAGKSAGRLRHNGFYGLGVHVGNDLCIVSTGNIAVLTLTGHFKK